MDWTVYNGSMPLAFTGAKLLLLSVGLMQKLLVKKTVAYK